MTAESTLPTKPTTAVSNWRQSLIRNTLFATLVFALAALVPALIDAIPLGHWVLVAVYVSAYAVLLAITILPAPYRVRAGVFLFLMFALGISSLYENALRGASRTYFFALIMMSLVFFNLRVSLVAFGAGVVSIVAMSILMIMGWVTPLDSDAIVPTWLELADTSATFVLLVTPVLIGLNLLQREFQSTQRREHQALEELARERDQLEQRVAERARTVERRTQQVAAGAEIARAASTELNPDTLIQRVVDLIRERFGLYYVGIFLTDDDNRYAVLRAGTGEAGKTLIARGHRLEVGGQSMIGRAVVDGQARIALDVGQEAVRFSNPVLPLTRSEMALPLVARDKAIGALTIQSDQSGAFGQEDIVSLQGMADLIAVALDNARLYREAQQALQEVSGVHRSYLSQAWETFARNRMADEGKPPTYMFADRAFTRGEAVTLPEVDRAIDEGRPVVVSDEQNSTVTVPITLREQVIGAVAIEAASPEHAWSEEDIALINAVIEQTALSLENARLIEETETALSETRRLASRERTVNAISNKIRRLPNVESVLTTALVELGRTLGANKGMVRLGVSSRRGQPAEPREETRND